ncbi:FAD binding domain-containing protein [Botrytis cinerea]
MIFLQALKHSTMALPKSTKKLSASKHIRKMSMKSFLESSPSTPVHGPLVRSPVRILGSGLSALTLARSLHKKKIPFKIFTKDCPPEDSPNRHDYSLSLPARSIRSLKLLLNMSTKSFQDHLLVPNTTPFPRGTTNTIVRVHRGRLERCLRSLFKDDIEWNCEIKVRSSGPSRLVFPPHVDALEGNITFDCMGVHSPVQCPGSYNVISPIVVFRGTVILSKTLWDQKFQDWFPRNTAHINKKFGATNLDLIINQISEQTGEVSLTYIYSRPVLDGLMDTEDELWKPTRPTHEAASPVLIEKFLDEIKTFRHKNVLPGPYNVIFNPEKMKEDRILHWLMRTLRADQPEAIKLWASDEKIMKLGDAVMSMPIVETIGAELAISDGLKAAEQIEKFGGRGCTAGLLNAGSGSLLYLMKVTAVCL